jgi:hypothetical protein
VRMIDDFRRALSEGSGGGGARYLLQTWCGLAWAGTKMRLGMDVAFRRSVVQAADQCEAENGTRGSGSSVVEHYKKCKASGDRAGMAFWRSVTVYSILSAMRGPEKIRIIDG